ncbi:MAG: class I SAM-dependent methyltransferase [Candidatus Pacearchaeota archaeon]|nr:class I SAM-dependent methyltransferase [Candidatus Pacearchaeota archaeon]
MDNQKKIWNNIAEEWYTFKTEPAEHTLEFLKKKKGNVLDLGSGAGRHLVKIKNGKMWLVDFSKTMIEFAKKRAKEKKIEAEFFVSDLTKIPFKNNFFDSAIAIAILHCIKGENNKKKNSERTFSCIKT